MTSEDWKQDPYAKSWLSKVSQRTRENYSATFPKWLAFVKMSPTEQIEKRVRNLQSGDLRERCWFEDKVIEYKNFLATQGYRAVTVHSYLISVQSFFSKNRLKLQFSRGDLNVEVSQKVIEQRWIPTNIEIRVMYSQANARDRGLLLVLYQSGFSEIDVASLNIDDLNDIYSHKGHLFIQKRREKTNIIQATCISTEAIHDIRAMLRQRDNPEKGALFVSQKGQRLSVRFINGAMKRLAKTAYPDKKFKTKSLRSAYNSALLRANIQPQELKDLLMGHKRAGARSHYAYDKITILEAYGKTFKYLSINSGTQVRKDLEDLKDYLEKRIEEQAIIIRKQQETIESMQNAIRDLLAKRGKITKSS